MRSYIFRNSKEGRNLYESKTIIRTIKNEDTLDTLQYYIKQLI